MKFPTLSLSLPVALRRRPAPVFTPFVIDGGPGHDGAPGPSRVREIPTPPAGTIGAILVASRRISARDAGRVMQAQGEGGASFGETALRLGIANADDIRYALAQQFALPYLAQGSDALSPEVVAAFHPAHEIVERLRIVRGQILQGASTPPEPQRTVAVASVERGAGRTFVAANLATVFAQLGHKTLLVDGDLLHPRQHEIFRLPARAGLSSILAQRAGLDAVQPVPSFRNFGFLAAGPLPPNAHDLYARDVFPRLLRDCEKIFDVVVLDTPAWNAGSGALMAVTAARNAVLVTRRGRTPTQRALAAARDMRANGAQLLGTLFNLH